MGNRASPKNMKLKDIEIDIHDVVLTWINAMEKTSNLSVLFQ